MGSYLASRYVGEAMDGGRIQELPHQVHLDFDMILEGTRPCALQAGMQFNELYKAALIILLD